MWHLNRTVNISLRLVASRWIGISSGTCSQLVLNTSSVACLLDPTCRWGHYPIEGRFGLTDIDSRVVTQIQIAVHFGDTDDSCRVTQRLKLEVSCTVRIVSLPFASSVYFCTPEKIRSCAEGSVVALTHKKITDLTRFAKCNYSFLWIWNGHSFPDPCSLPTSNLFWSLQSRSHFE